MMKLKQRQKDLDQKTRAEAVQLSFDDNHLVRTLLGQHDENLKQIEKKMGVTVNVRGNLVRVIGEEERARLTRKLLQELYFLLESKYALSGSDVDYAIKMLKENGSVNLKDVFLDAIYVPSKRRTVTPKSIGQKRYLDAIRKHDIVIGIGPAGTGKTYLAMAAAIDSLLKKEVDRIILTRPAVEAGEKLGFLPGDMFEKVNPYLRPLHDALHDMMDLEKVSQLAQRGTIEVAPLAFMRGRTLNDSFVILDEAQNTTSEQMKMFLTRLGFSSKAVVTGDITQVDLPAAKVSGLIEVQDILGHIEGIKFIYFTEKDVVRHSLVQEIIKAYERANTGGGDR
jgi:phosphate starvation-inducible PhoH-like protein